MENRRLRVLFVTNIPSPYQIDFFTALHQRPELSIEVLFCAATESDRQFEIPDQFPFPGEILKSYRLPGTPKDCHVVPGMNRILRAKQPFDIAILSGSYFMPAVIATRRFMQQQGISWYYWGENPLKKCHRGWKDRFRSAYLRSFLRDATGVLGIGKRACESYRKILGNDKNISNLCYSPNLAPLLEPTESTIDLARQMKDSWPVEDPFVIFFSGSLTDRKAPDVLVKSFLMLTSRLPSLCLQIAGDGPLKDALFKILSTSGYQHRVRFLGFQTGYSLAASYLSSNLFILPTRTHEGWGVVVQEALAAGLPVIASDRVGSIEDFQNSANEIIHVVPVNDPESLATAIEQMSWSSKTRHTISRHARDAARGTSSTESARKLCHYLKTMQKP